MSSGGGVGVLHFERRGSAVCFPVSSELPTKSNVASFRWSYNQNEAAHSAKIGLFLTASFGLCVSV